MQHPPGRDLVPDLTFAWDPKTLRTRQFASLLAQRQAWTIDVIGIGRDLEREIEATLRLIRDIQER